MNNEFIRKKDGYINLNQLCKSGGKNFKEWKKNNKSKKTILALSKILKLKPEELIVYEINGKTDQANWGHPKIATILAVWVSVEFSVKVSEWIEEWKLYKEENKGKYITEMKNIKGNDYLDTTEKNIQYKLQQKLGGITEVETPDGYIDLLTDKEIIEIKTMKKWKHALGQVLAYGYYYPKHQKRIHLFNTKGDVSMIKKKLKDFNIELTYET